MSYIKLYFRYIVLVVSVFVFFNFYYVVAEVEHLELLIYGDVLVGLGLVVFFGVDACLYYKKQRMIQQHLADDEVISNYLLPFTNSEIALHDIDVMQDKMNLLQQMNQDLNDYITKWVHEVKLPLSSLLMVNDNYHDSHDYDVTKEQLEKINIALNNALMSCKLNNNFYDIQYKRISLLDCIQMAIKNNRYFLIQKGFDIQIEVKDIYVYSDAQWLTYILEQLINNAIKYAKDNPVLSFTAVSSENQVKLFVKDNGEGIKDYDIPRIFERGYVGSNHHNGQHKSSGMGLYMVKKMTDQLHHQITVHSVYGQYSEFVITFNTNQSFFMQ